MAKNAYIGVSNVARKVKQPYIGVSNVARKVKNGYIGVSNVARQFFQSGTPLTYDNAVVGQSLYMNVDGVRTEFILVHKDALNSKYGGEKEGFVMLMKDIWRVDYYHSSHAYSHRMSSYLANNFLPLLDAAVKSCLLTVKLPYFNGTAGSSSSNVSISTGESGIAQQVFLLALRECSITNNNDAIGYDSQKLDYFNSGGSPIANYNGTATAWWTRSPYYNQHGQELCVSATGTGISKSCNTSTTAGIRPALMLPYNVLVDDSGNVLGL